MSAQLDLFAQPMRRIETPAARNTDIRPIPGWPDYFASSDGHIFSAKRGGWLRLRHPTCGMYDSVSLCRDGRISSMNVHRAVALAFLGDPAGADVVRHLDGNSRNNHVTNLAYGTYAENEADKARHGRRIIGSNVYGSKLTDAKVVELRNEFLSGVTFHEIAERYGLHESSAFDVIHGETWKHLPVPDYTGRVVTYPDGHPNRGERHGMAKLTEESAARAVEMLRQGHSNKVIASLLGVSRQAISHIAAGRTWKHLTAGRVRRGPLRHCAVTGRLAMEWLPA